MENILQRFEEIKKQRVKFINETNEKSKLYLSNINNKLNTFEKNLFNSLDNNNDIQIENISNQFKKITSIINKYEYYSKNLKNYQENFFDFIENKIKSIENYEKFPLLSNEKINNLKNIINITQELIKNNENLILGNSCEEKKNILNKINENFNLLNNELQINYKIEDSLFNKIINLLRRIKFFIYNNHNIIKLNSNLKNFVYIQDDYNIEKISKESRILKINFIKKNNLIYKIKHKFKNNNIIKEKYYDIKLYLKDNNENNNEMKKNILLFIKNKIMKNYVITILYTKNINLICINIFGIGKKNLNIQKIFSNLLLNNNILILIKFIKYDNLDILFRKKFSIINNEIMLNKISSNLHHNFKEEFINKYLNNQI